MEAEAAAEAAAAIAADVFVFCLARLAEGAPFSSSCSVLLSAAPDGSAPAAAASASARCRFFFDMSLEQERGGLEREVRSAGI
jgi:hypothetical protein